MLNGDADPDPSTPVRPSFGKTRGAGRLRTLMPPRLAIVLIFLGILIPEVVTFHFMGPNSPVWLTNAVAVTTLLRNARTAWPGLILAQILADTAAGLISGIGFVLGFGSGVCGAFEILVVSAALRSIGGNQVMFANLGRIFKFAAICIVAPAFTACAGAVLLHATVDLSFQEAWRTWYLSETFGLLIVTPFLILWTETGRFKMVSRWAQAEIILLTMLVGFVGWIDFSFPALPGLFLGFPFLLLAAFRGGLLGATSASVALVGVASVLTLTGHGEIAHYPGTTVAGHVLLLQLYFAAILLSSLPVAVMLEQRKLLSQFQTVAELSRMARHDYLTGLPNRLLFHERLAWTQAETRRHGGHTALLMLDLDRFKPVNDLHGHAAGDRLLEMVASRLRDTVREADTIARLGGDEFAVLGHVTDAAMATSFAQRIIAALSKPFCFLELSVEIGCSIGIALNPSDGGDDAGNLVQQADSALYQAKGEGRNVFRYFKPGMDDAVRRRAEMEVELRRAILLDQVTPKYQPIVALRDAKIVGFEMLGRWNHPMLGDIPPSVFVPLAESFGLIGVLSEQLIRKACVAALTWPEPMFVTVNVSPLQLRDRALPALIRSILAETGLPPLRLEIELTESALIEDFDLAHKILVDLKSTGIRLALDDFGTGYSSLRHLLGLPLDKIKIDRSFVGTINSVLASRKIVAGVIGMAHSLGLSIVAEGIEEVEVAGILKLLGCDLGQGWLYGRAMPADDVTTMLRLPGRGNFSALVPAAGLTAFLPGP